MVSLREPESRTVHANGLEIHYLDWGGDGRPVICLHGITSNCHLWDSLARHLPPQFRLFAPDLRGHGNSGWPDTGYSFDDMAGDLEGFLAQLGLKHPIIIGHSLGGRIAIYHLAHFQNVPQKLVVIDSGIGMSIPKGEGGRRRNSVPRRYDSIEHYTATMKQMPLNRNWSADTERHVLFGALPMADGTVEMKMSREGARQIVRAVLDCDLTQYFDRIQCPTLVIRAAEGNLPAETAALMAQRIALCKLAVMEGTNHNVPLDNPTTFEQIVIEFLT